MGKLNSRKLWVTIGFGVLYGILKQIGFPIPEGVVNVVITYLAGQSAVDIANAIGEAKANGHLGKEKDKGVKI